MTLPNRATRTLLIAGLIVQVSGCAFASRLLGVGASKRDVAAAATQDDMERLTAICEGRVATESRDVQTFACEQREEVIARQAALTGECDTLAAAYEDTGAPNRAYVEAMAKRLAECGNYETLFEDLVHWGNSGEGAEILAGLEEEGFDVNGAWADYLETHQGMEFMANDDGNAIRYGSAHIREWLEQAGHSEHCAAIARAASHSEWGVQAAFLPYLSKCDEGVDIMVELLTSKNYGERVQACKALAEHGRPRDLEVLDIVAQTDPYMAVDEVERNDRVYAVETWPVRRACTDAIGQIRIRQAQP